MTISKTGNVEHDRKISLFLDTQTWTPIYGWTDGEYEYYVIRQGDVMWILNIDPDGDCWEVRQYEWK